jgi:hypothetical protein
LQQPAVDRLQHSGRRMGDVIPPEFNLGRRHAGWWLANVTQGDGFTLSWGARPRTVPAVEFCRFWLSASHAVRRIPNFPHVRAWLPATVFSVTENARIRPLGWG